MDAAPEVAARNADYLTSVMRAKLDQDPALAQIVVEGQGDRVLLHLPVKELLAADAANAPAGERLVYALGGALNTMPNRVAVEVRPDRPAEFSAGLAYAKSVSPSGWKGRGRMRRSWLRARLTEAGEPTGIVLIVFDTAPAPAGGRAGR